MIPKDMSFEKLNVFGFADFSYQISRNQMATSPVKTGLRYLVIQTR